jgi:hypothetical protein
VVPDGLSARLTVAGSRAPVAQEQLTFTAHGTTLCTATTNRSGTGGCTSLSAVLGAVVDVGYEVAFGGTAVYEPSSAKANAFGLANRLITLDGEHVPRGDRSNRPYLEARLAAIGKPQLERELEQLRASRH